jgi:hypothetical protein
MGRSEYGLLGLGSDTGDAKVPTLIPSHSPVTNMACVGRGGIACDTTVSLAITASGELHAWGLGTNGQLGQGNEEDLTVPTVTRIMSQQLENRRGDPCVGGWAAHCPNCQGKKNTCRHHRNHVEDWYAYILMGRDTFERRGNIEMDKVI